MRISRWFLFAVYGALCGIAISPFVVNVRFGTLALLLAALCPMLVAFSRGLTRWSVIGATALVLAIELPTLNIVASCWTGRNCGMDAVEVMLVGFAYLFPLVSLPATFFLWAFLNARRHGPASPRDADGDGLIL